MVSEGGCEVGDALVLGHDVTEPTLGDVMERRDVIEAEIAWVVGSKLGEASGEFVAPGAVAGVLEAAGNSRVDDEEGCVGGDVDVRIRTRSTVEQDRPAPP